MTCDTCENRMCKDAPLFTQERIAKDCLDNGRKLYVPPNQTESFRGKRAQLNLYDDYIGFDCRYVINKSHKDGDVTVIDNFTITSINVEVDEI